jgi:PTH1 family peptidyl-tRNA hydrolase
MSKFLIAGLGNIGDEYTFTRHNIGFLVADALVSSLVKDDDKKSSSKLFTLDKNAMVNHSKYRGKTIVIIKPTTYMNLSGKAVNYWLNAENIPIENLLVVTDDIALPYGALRMKKKGSAGGHNGLSDIITALGTEEFPRLRFGIGNEFRKGSQVDYVLGKWEKEEEKILPERIETSVQMIKSFIFAGIERTMTQYNKK